MQLDRWDWSLGEKLVGGGIRSQERLATEPCGVRVKAWRDYVRDRSQGRRIRGRPTVAYAREGSYRPEEQTDVATSSCLTWDLPPPERLLPFTGHSQFCGTAWHSDLELTWGSGQHIWWDRAGVVPTPENNRREPCGLPGSSW